MKQQPGVAEKLQTMALALSNGRGELELTDQLQRLLFPMRLPEVRGIDVATRFIPSPTGTSDLYDVFETAEGMVGFFLVEAPDSGIVTALMMIMTKVAFDEARSRLYSPAEIMQEVNNQIFERNPDGFPMKAFLGYLDLATLRLRYVNGAMLAPLLFGTGAVKPLAGKDEPLGKAPLHKFAEHEITIEPGTGLFLYSSGVTRAKDETGRAYSASRLKSLLRENPDMKAEKLVATIAGDLCSYVKEDKFEQDATFIVVELGPELDHEVKIVIPTDPSQLGHIVDAIMDRLKRLNYGERSLFAIRLCLEEALINAMKHGNRMDRTKTVTVSCQADEHEVRISIEDQGDGFLPEAVPDPRNPENLEVAHGRGLLLMYSYMDSVEYCDKGNRVTIVKKSPWE